MGQQGHIWSDWGSVPRRHRTDSFPLRAYLAYNNISHILPMEQRIRGVNFDGSVRLSEGELSLEVIEFESGHIYRFQTTPEQLTASFKQFLVIKRLEELFDELVGNHQSFVSKEEQLIIPIAVGYRGRIEALNVEVRLEKVVIEDERELNWKYLKEIQRMSKENLTIDRYKEKAIRFKPDLNSTIIKSFEVIPQRSLIRYAANNQHSIINHAQPLPRVGIHSFKARIIKTYSKNIIFGICSFDIRYTVNNYHSPYFLGLSLSEKTVLGNNKSDVAIQPVELVEGRSVVKVEVDMNKSVISWFLDDGFLCARRIPGEITSKDVYPIISLYNMGDALELIA